MSLFMTYMGDHWIIEGTVSNLRPVCLTKQNLVNNKKSFLVKYLSTCYQ